MTSPLEKLNHGKQTTDHLSIAAAVKEWNIAHPESFIAMVDFHAHVNGEIMNRFATAYYQVCHLAGAMSDIEIRTVDTNMTEYIKTMPPDTDHATRNDAITVLAAVQQIMYARSMRTSPAVPSHHKFDPATYMIDP